MKRLSLKQYASTAIEARLIAFVASRWDYWSPRRYLHIAIGVSILALAWLTGGVAALMHGW